MEEEIKPTRKLKEQIAALREDVGKSVSRGHGAVFHDIAAVLALCFFF